MNLSEGVLLNPMGGSALSVKHQRIADIIHDYEPTLELVMLPIDKRDDEDSKKYPFAVIHYPPGLPPYLVKRYRDSEVDERILADLFMHDNVNGSVLDRIEAEEAARNALKMRERLDAREEMKDFVATVTKSPLHAFTHNGVRYD